MNKTSKKRLETNKRWNDKNSKSYAFRLMYKRDREVMDRLEAVPSKADYFRALMEADIAGAIDWSRVPGRETGTPGIDTLYADSDVTKNDTLYAESDVTK